MNGDDFVGEILLGAFIAWMYGMLWLAHWVMA